eukprot:g14565.t1
MSRRQAAQPVASPETVFAKRRGEIPYQIYFEVSNIGRNVESSKKRARWKFCFGEEGREHEVTLIHSLMSGKKKTIFDGELINEAQKVSKEWVFAWSFGAHLLRVGINFEEYGLVIDGIPFRNFSRRDPYLAAQLEATKRDSMRSLQTDEKRRFDRLGYSSGDGGGGGGSGGRRGSGDSGGRSRSRTAERSRGGGGSSAASSKEDSQRRATSNGRSSLDRGGGGASRRSGSVDGRRSSPPAGPSSTRRMQAPPSASGPGGDQRRSTHSTGGGGGGKARATKPSSNAAPSPAAATADADILSADPSTLEVNPFDVHVPAASFDPLNNGAAGAGATAGGGYANGGGGGGGGWAGAGGDSAAVLQLGMQFEAMGTSSQFQQQAPPQQQQQQFVQQRQQQQYQAPFDQGVYQQYDQSGFPMPQQQHQQHQQPYNSPPPQQLQQQQHQPAGPFGDAAPRTGGLDLLGGFSQPQQGQQQQQQQGGAAGGPPAETCTTLAMASVDPWDMARSGMVNIDDITDTKHLPAVEVKPFTNDHRPLADLVREAPPKTKNTVMIERPEPPPTHMAVAIVPVQPQGGFPQQAQNGNNPFAQLQLTQFGQQAQPPMQRAQLAMMEEDPFWLVQLTNNNDESRMLAGETPQVEYEDRALPAGTCTEQSLAGVLGCESEVSIPAGWFVRCRRPDEDDDRCGPHAGEDVDDGSGSGSGGGGTVESRLVLKLRQVNGDGILSGVGGDVWCAALLLSSWLLQAPKIVQGLDVLELGSGLGLCGIVAGYLAESITLTDYVDELVMNLQHNIEINRSPRVDNILGDPPPPPTAAARGDGGAAVRASLDEPRGRQQQRQRQPQQQQQQQQARLGGGRELADLRRLSRSRARACRLDWTDYEHGGRRNGPCHRDNDGDDDVRRGGGGHRMREWWWDETGKPADYCCEEGAATETPTPLIPDSSTAASSASAAVLRCDVMIGSALIYSPRHACVADVLSLAFEEGGCRAAYIVQLSTRPGFDDFLHRLRACGLRYRLQRISHVLPAVVLEDIRRNTPVSVVGGPVMRPIHEAGDGGACIGGGVADGGNGQAHWGTPTGAVAPAAGFDEFVLCSVFRGGEIT